MLRNKLLVLALALTLTGCGNEKPKETIEERNIQQLLARISELEAENKELKDQLGSNRLVSNEEAVEETLEEFEESAPVSDQSETEEGYVQYVQSQPGNTQTNSYFTLTTDKASYTQTSDAFVTKSTYDDTQILVIPIKYKNLSDDTQDPWMNFSMDYRAYQEDDTQEYTLNGGQGGLPEEYSAEPFLDLKPGAEYDYFIAYELEIPNSDVILGEYFRNDIHQTFKFQ